jgi:hypothetical protein
MAENFTLLRQALGDRPFLQPRGGILAKWDALTATLVDDEGFPRGEWKNGKWPLPQAREGLSRTKFCPIWRHDQARG